MPGSLTPSLREDVVRLSTWMPFGRAVKELHYFRGTDVSKSTVVRLTEGAGAAYVAVQQEEVARIEEELPLPTANPAKLFFSVDGAMVPLVGGIWAEVKTMVIGDIRPPRMVNGEEVIGTTNHTYFSRMIDSETFTRLALVETQRRGVENADGVAAVTDGAEWIQKFIDHHCDDAVRILDFPHAAEYVNQIGKTVWGEDEEAKEEWLSEQLHRLKHQGAEPVVTVLRGEIDKHPQNSDLAGALAYLKKREEHMQYHTFHAEGWPIGDGAVESANKLVVEARLKGSGMHWAPTNVNSMLALRNIAANDRWDEAWPQITRSLRQQARANRAQRRRQRRDDFASTSVLPLASPIDIDSVPPASPLPIPAPQPTTSPETPNPATRQPWKPAPDHPWRRMPIGRARFNSALSPSGAKL